MCKQQSYFKKEEGDEGRMILPQPTFVCESLSKEACMNLSRSWTICHLLWGERRGIKGSILKLVQLKIKFSNGAIMTLSHTASSAENQSAFESLHPVFFFLSPCVTELFPPQWFLHPQNCLFNLLSISFLFLIYFLKISILPFLLCFLLATYPFCLEVAQRYLPPIICCQWGELMPVTLNVIDKLR